MSEQKTHRKRKERERLERLERGGRIRLGSGRVREEFWDLPRPEDPEGLLRKALLKDRREGR